MKSKIDEVLDLLLVDITAGKSIDESLEKFPELSQELEPLLRIADRVKNLDRPEARPEAIAAVLIKVGEIIAENRRQEKKPSFRRLLMFQPALVRVVAVILLLFAAGWTGLSLSAKSMPGDFLYPVKRLTETIQYFFTVDRQGKVELHLVFAGTRTEELMQSFQKGEKLDKKLLSAMLNEAQIALKNAESLPGACPADLMVRISACNLYQQECLESIKARAQCCDTTVVNEAMNLCSERHHCLDHKLNPGAHPDQMPCPCPWDKHCDWQ